MLVVSALAALRVPAPDRVASTSQALPERGAQVLNSVMLERPVGKLDCWVRASWLPIVPRQGANPRRERLTQLHTHLSCAYLLSRDTRRWTALSFVSLVRRELSDSTCGLHGSVRTRPSRMSLGACPLAQGSDPRTELTPSAHAVGAGETFESTLEGSLSLWFEQTGFQAKPSAPLS